MENLKEKIEELSNAPVSIRIRVDALLELDSGIRDLGRDFTKESLTEAKTMSKMIYEAISKIDPATGKMLILTIDK